MKVCICGGGNLAHASAGEFANNENVSEVNILTRHPEKWSTDLDIYYEHEFSHSVKINTVTSDYSILTDMDVVFITIPAFARYEYLLKIKDYISPKTLLVVAPSVGGVNFIFDNMFPNNQYMCCQRVPYICRIKEYGHSVYTEVKTAIDVYYSENVTLDSKKMVGNLFKMDLRALSSFWPLVLSNSNPIIHMARLCEILNGTYPCAQNPLFYELWGDEASELALKMDQELGEVMKCLDVQEYRPLKQHYEINNVREFTQKIHSIESFRAILSPMVEENGEYVIDKTSRYVIEDLPYGTLFIKYFAQKFGIKTPTFDYAISKIQNFSDVKFVNENGNLNTDIWFNYLGFANYLEGITA